jgi:hypothetical protein
MLDNPKKLPLPAHRASGSDTAPLDDRVLSLLDHALSDLQNAGLVAIEVAVARQRLREWRKNARRYERIASLAPDEMRALAAKASCKGATLDTLVDAIDEQRLTDRARIDFLKQQGYWDALVGPDDTHAD